MNNHLIQSLAIRLCCADMCCGYISVAPVLDNREQLIKQRLLWYQEWLAYQIDHLQEEMQVPYDILSHQLTQAVALTSADILSDAISLAPVLYDRDSKIKESVSNYFSWLHPGVAESAEDYHPEQ